MKCIEMRYAGTTFPVNPKSIEIQYEKRTAALPILKAGTRVQSVCRAPTVIRGSGVFTGPRAQAQAETLSRLFYRREAATLFSPVLPPLRMFFTALTITAAADGEGIAFSFRFTEEYGKKQGRYRFGYTIAGADENLYDIAHRCEVPVEELFALNQYSDLFSVKEGDKVWLK